MTTAFTHRSEYLTEVVARAEESVARFDRPAAALAELGSEPSTWFHSFILSDGSAVLGLKSGDFLRAEFDAILGPVPLTERTVLDIGAWNGAFSFEAKRRG